MIGTSDRGEAALSLRQKATLFLHNHSLPDASNVGRRKIASVNIKCSDRLRRKARLIGGRGTGYPVPANLHVAYELLRALGSLLSQKMNKWFV